ncbi:hypothetical protein MACH09_36120 [Vibrio sp. MACH09]|uniref:hypothetical protein n=1 Tax=unclassified Vibrio TaxID=2614977 RepID=UPI001493C56C|nr:MULTISPECIES: hypothetical protein [unclassified Vibrio]GLO63104.1 hypothetical protein MACH09_36120 [Vibrio sp. MACH09]
MNSALLSLLNTEETNEIIPTVSASVLGGVATIALMLMEVSAVALFVGVNLIA